MNNFNHAIEIVLKHEGGYVNNPNDPGGETKYGISKRSYPNLEIKKLTIDQAKEIYHNDWWIKYRYNQIIDIEVATKIFDISINIGPANMHRILQRSVNFVSYTNLKVDGIIGPMTINATNNSDFDILLEEIKHQTAEYYYFLVKRNNKLREFLFGWLNRAYS